MADPGGDATAARRAEQLVAQYAARGIALSAEQAAELASAVDKLQKMKDVVRAAALTPRRT